MAIIIRSKSSGNIIIDWGGIRSIQRLVDTLSPFKIGIVTNSTVMKHWLTPVVESLKGNISTFIVDDGEKFKTLDTVENIWKKMIKEHFSRKSLVIGLGGGVITDIAGFVASTYMRGIYLMHVPTSLMAQIDAAIGGKNGFDFFGKNIIGTFYPATYVLVDPSTLSTLPRNELVNGLAEVAKYGIISDKSFFEFLEYNSEKIAPNQKKIMTEIITRSIRIKVQIVDRDFHENNLRMILNFGHTIAHGLEKASDYRIKHGFAVAIGIVINCFIAEELLNFKESDRVIDLLHSLGLPTSFNLDPKDVLEAIKVDKKAWYGKPVFVLPTRIGNVVLREVPEEVVLRALRRGTE